MLRTFAVMLSVVVLSVAAAGCRSPRRRWEPTQGDTVMTGGAETLSAEGVVATGPPRQQLEQLDGVLRGNGYAATGPAVHGNLASHALIAYAVDAEPGRCYTLAVVGEDPGQNIDIIVLDPYGRPSSHNVRPDNHPWVSFCAAAAGRFIARVQMAAGQGGYYYASYAGPAGRQMELSSFFGDQREETVQVARMDAETQARLAQLDRELGAQGFTRLGEPAGVVLETQAPRDFDLRLQAGQCYAFATFGGPGSVDTDIMLNDSSGQQLEADRAAARDAVIRYCAGATGSYELSVRMYTGRGPLFTVGYAQRGQAAAEPVMAQTSTAHAGLRENFALLDADMRARGYESYGTEVEGSLAAGANRNFEIQLEGGRCYAILAVGDAGVRDLDLLLLDGSGDEVDRDIANDPRPTVRVCPQRSGNFYMQVRMTEGAGSYFYAPYRWPRGTSGRGMSGLAWLRSSEVTALLDVEGYQPDAGFDVESGHCYAVVVVGGDGVNDLDITLTDGVAQLASDYGSHNAFPSVRHCPAADGRYTVNITASNGAGPYHMQVFSPRPDE
jgi:hypothetical protein